MPNDGSVEEHCPYDIDHAESRDNWLLLSLPNGIKVRFCDLDCLRQWDKAATARMMRTIKRELTA